MIRLDDIAAMVPVIFRRTGALFVSCLLILSFCQIALCQQDVQRDKVQEEIINREAERHGMVSDMGDVDDTLSQELEYDYGGFISFMYTKSNDGATQQSTEVQESDLHIYRTTDLRLWANVVYQNTHQVHARVFGTITDYNKGTNYSYLEQNDINAPRLDVGYYHLDVTRLIDFTDWGELSFRAGRDMFSVGSGLALSKRGDGALLEYTLDDFMATGFVFRSIYSDDNTDFSHPDRGHDKRSFYGMELNQKITRELELFGFFVIQRDKQKRYWWPASDIKFGMHTEHYGTGVRGSFGPDFEYSAEYIHESGEGYPYAIPEETGREDVDAYAYHADATYTFRTVKTQPNISVQYALGSGDSDAGNTRDTFNGNMQRTDFDAFSYFGYMNTGLAFFPYVSNLEMIRVGSAFNPIEDHRIFGDLEAGVNLFGYWRHKSKGGVSDRKVVPGHGKLGEEVDCYFLWRPFSDLTVLAQYGYFWPEARSYGGNDKERFFFSISAILFF